MTHRSHIVIFSLLFSMLLFNCTVSKRHYRKGYHVAWNIGTTKESVKTLSAKKQERKQHLTKLETQVEQIVSTAKTELLASAEYLKHKQVNKFKPKPLVLASDSCGDVIVFRDGTEITVKVVEVFNETVRYLPCDNLEGPLRVSNGEKIFMIKYANGTKEVFKEKAKEANVTLQPYKQGRQDKEGKPKRTNGLALASFICSMMWFLFIPALVAVILGVIALNQISNNPDKYSGKSKFMAKFGVIVGGIASAIWILALANS